MRLTALLTCLSLSLSALASPLSPASSSSDLVARENDQVKYLGSQGSTLSGGTKFGDLVFVSGQVPILNGTVVPGGIKNETAFVIERVGAILKEGGTDWSKVLKVTVLLQGELEGSADDEARARMRAGLVDMTLTLAPIPTYDGTPLIPPDIRDIGAMNEVYAAMIPNPKPARATFEVGNLPVFGISIEMEGECSSHALYTIVSFARWHQLTVSAIAAV
jgi:enamine deaminase RidA (YjgF/YER057c/UK114 family)